MTFLSAGLLGGLLLATVPIIIHILNRRRFLVIDWPPMKYLKLTLKKNRKRIRIEQMILLAMRTLAVILLILAVARPVISQGSLSKFMPGRARVSRIIVIDDSLSMGYTTAGRTAFAVAQQAAADLLKAAGAQDAVTILLTSAPDRPLIKDASMQDAARFSGMVAALHVTDTANHWGATLQAVRTAAGAATFSNKEIVILTDMRSSGWGGNAKGGDDDVTLAANALAAAGIPVRIIDVGDRRTDNIALQKFDLEDAIPLPDQPMHLMATIRNNTAAALANGQAILSVDGDRRPVLLPNLPAGATTNVPLTLTLNSPGTHTLALSLPNDAMPADGTRYLAVTVRPTVSVLLVDGAPSAQAFESETDFLALAYSVGARPWTVLRTSEFDARHLASESAIPDVVILANVPSLTTDQVAGLEKLVEKGMGLMIFTGDQIDEEAYNSRMFRAGKGLLPAALDRVTDTPTAGIAIEKDAQSPLAAMGKLLPAALARVRTRQYTTLQIGSANSAMAEGVSVLARWNNAENPPAVIEKVFGKGRVLLFTTTAGKKWTDWPLDPTYVLGMRSAALGIARSQEIGGTVEAGEALHLTFDPGHSVLDPHATTSDAKTPEAVDVETSPAGTTVRYARTLHSGIDTLTWRDEKSKPASAQFAVNPPTAESDLEPLTDAQLAALMGNLKPTVQRYDIRGVGLDAPPRELWRPLATILLCLMAAEAAFAAWVGRER